MLSYTIPKHVTRKMGMSLVKVYLSGQKFITWTPIDNFDPEISDAQGLVFPNTKSSNRWFKGSILI